MNQWYKPGPDHILSLSVLRVHRSTKLPAVCVHTSRESPEANHRWYFTVSVFHSLSPHGIAMQEISMACSENSSPYFMGNIWLTLHPGNCWNELMHVGALQRSTGGINFQIALSTSLRPQASSRFSQVTPWLSNPSFFFSLSLSLSLSPGLLLENRLCLFHKWPLLIFKLTHAVEGLSMWEVWTHRSYCSCCGGCSYFTSGVSNPAPGELKSCRFQHNTPEPANQGVQGFLIITDRCDGAGLEL